MYKNVPKQLKEMKRWVCYQAIQKGDRLTKVPINPSSGKGINVNAQDNWLNFKEAVNEHSNEAYQITGVGFVFSELDSFVGIDLDDCIDETGGFSELAKDIIDRFNDKAYIEISPSGRGLHVIAIGKKPKGLTKNSQYGIEMYDQKRYF